MDPIRGGILIGRLLQVNLYDIKMRGKSNINITKQYNTCRNDFPRSNYSENLTKCNDNRYNHPAFLNKR
jgi:hypothetical protein